MEDEISSNVPDTKNTKVICRSGDTTNPVDLEIVNPKNAKSIILLGKDAHESDFEIIKTILAITNNPNRKSEPYHIIAEMREVQNYDVAKMIAKNEAELVLTDDIVARIMVQTSRQSGLSVVYTELMDYGGDEIYYKPESKLTGKTYAEAIMMYESSCIMGLQQNGNSLINPPMDTIINSGDEIIAISADDDTIVMSNKHDYQINNNAITKEKTIAVKKIERIVLLGWNRRVIRVIKELNNYVGAGSEILVVANQPLPDELRKENTGIFENINLLYKEADTSNRNVLESLNVFTADYIMLFSYELENDIQRSDSITLITLLHLRDMSEKANKDLNLVSEMLDLKNRELAEVTNADDFIVSDKMLSLLITQVSENKHLMRVFEDILDEAGSEIYMKPITEYIHVNEPVNFYTLCASGVQKGHTVIGYRLMADEHNAAKSYGIQINPEKSKMVQFSADDKLIVLADD
jgi:ion channel POLLUX/CASTOR